MSRLILLAAVIALALASRWWTGQFVASRPAEEKASMEPWVTGVWIVAVGLVTAAVLVGTEHPAPLGFVLGAYFLGGALIDRWSGYLPNVLHMAAVIACVPVLWFSGALSWTSLVSGLSLMLVVAVPALFNPRAVGGGDVKLAGVLGLLMGFVAGGLLWAVANLLALPQGLLGRYRHGKQYKVRMGPYFLLSYAAMVIVSRAWLSG